MSKFFIQKQKHKMRWSGRGNERAGDRLQLRTGCGLARWTVLALTMCSVGALEQTQLNAWQSLYDGTGGGSWSRCSGNRANPCSCSRVTCVGEDMTELKMYSSNLQGMECIIYCYYLL